MDESGTLFEQLLAVWQALKLQLAVLAQPSRQYQVLILLICIALATLINRYASKPIHEWMRDLRGRPKWQLRLLILLHKRLRLVIFICLAWVANGLAAQIWDLSFRRYLITLAASIATAWLIVGLATRLVKNSLLRRVLTWGLWVYVTLYLLRLLDPTLAFLDGIAVMLGGVRLSLLNVLKAALAIAVLVALARLVSRAATRRIAENAEISASMQVLTIKLLQFAFYTAAFFFGLNILGFDLTGLAFLSGAIGIGIGFGLQKVVSNLMSGVIILLDKSIKPGDVISLGETFGWINELGARYVSVVTRDGREFLIPNEDMVTQQVVNWSHTDDFVRLDITFHTSYADDPHLVRKVAVSAASKVKRVLPSHPAVCHITEFGESGIGYILRFWIKDPTDGLTNIKGNVYLALWDAFRANGITHPYPRREIRVQDQRDGLIPGKGE